MGMWIAVAMILIVKSTLRVMTGTALMEQRDGFVKEIKLGVDKRPFVQVGKSRTYVLMPLYIIQILHAAMLRHSIL